MFRDPLSVRIKNIVFPFLLWVAAGAAAEVLAAFLVIASGRGQGGFLAALSLAHEAWEDGLVLFRAVSAIPFFFLWMKRDTQRIRTTLSAAGADLPERCEFFTASSRFSGYELLSIPAGAGFMLFMSMLFRYLGLKDTVFSGSLRAMQPIELLVFLILQVIAGPLSEELLLRGLIYRRLRTWCRMTAAVMVSSLIFALLHWNASQLLYAFFFGIVLAFLYEGSGRLRDAAAAHVSANLFAVFLRYRMDLSLKLAAHKGLAAVISGTVFFAGFLLFMRSANAEARKEDMKGSA